MQQRPSCINTMARNFPSVRRLLNSSVSKLRRHWNGRIMKNCYRHRPYQTTITPHRKRRSFLPVKGLAVSERQHRPLRNQALFQSRRTGVGEPILLPGNRKPQHRCKIMLLRCCLPHLHQSESKSLCRRRKRSARLQIPLPWQSSRTRSWVRESFQLISPSQKVPLRTSSRQLHTSNKRVPSLHRCLILSVTSPPSAKGLFLSGRLGWQAPCQYLSQRKWKLKLL